MEYIKNDTDLEEVFEAIYGNNEKLIGKVNVWFNNAKDIELEFLIDVEDKEVEEAYKRIEEFDFTEYLKDESL